MARHNTATEGKLGSPHVYLKIDFSDDGEEKIIRTNSGPAKSEILWDESFEVDGDRLSFHLIDASSYFNFASATWTNIGAALGDLANDGIVSTFLKDGLTCHKT